MTNPIYALCIGVSDYTNFAPSGRLNLPGATRDAFRWQQLCEHHFGLAPDQIRVHSAAKGAEPTTRKGIKAGLRWLGTQIGKNKDSSGLLTFSGHGLTMQQSGDDALEEGMTLALAPSNIKPNLKASLNFQHIEQILFEAIAEARFGKTDKLSKKQEASICKSMENITAVLDACYDQPADAKGSIRALTKAVAPPKMPEPPPKVFARLMLACQLWETAYEVKVANEPIGAFTFAITTMIEQWLTGTDDGTAVTYSRASYGDLVFRARTLINTLGLQEQNPALVGTMNNLALLPFLRPGTGIAKGRTSVAPDGWRKGEEFSPDYTDGAQAGDAVVIEIQGSTTNNAGDFKTIGWVVVPSAEGEYPPESNDPTQQFSSSNQYFFFATGVPSGTNPPINFQTGWNYWQLKVSSLSSWNDLNAPTSAAAKAVVAAVQASQYSYPGSEKSGQVVEVSTSTKWTSVTTSPPNTVNSSSSHTTNFLFGYSGGVGPSSVPNFGIQMEWDNASYTPTGESPIQYVLSVTKFTAFSLNEPSPNTGSLIAFLSKGSSQPLIIPLYSKFGPFIAKYRGWFEQVAFDI